MIKNKKGEDKLLSEFLGVIIAIIAVGILVYAGYKFYSLMPSEFDNAKNIADSLESKIKVLDAGDSTKNTIQSPCREPGVCKWNIQGWGKDQPGRPDRCFFDSCICVCNGLGSEACQDSRTGICRKVEAENVDVKMSTRTFSSLEGGKIEAYVDEGGNEVCKNIALKSALIDVKIFKEKDKLTLSLENANWIEKEECAK